MSAPEAVAFPARAGATPAAAHPLRALAWAVLASTAHRIRRGEGALLAVNLSLVAQRGTDAARGTAEAIVSMLAIGVMYAFNDLYDAPADWRNPKKDRALVGVYFEHRRAGVVATAVLSVLTAVLAAIVLAPAAAAAVVGVMIVNVVYSVWLKGVPVADVAWVWLWGAVYAGIVGASPTILAIVGLMTAICHLFQALDDRVPDAANGIATTAVRSLRLSRRVLVALCVILFVVMRGPFGTAGALTAFTPLAIFFAVRDPGAGWLLTKAYFGVMWLYLLGLSGAAG